MVFRKNALLFYQSEIIYTLMIVVCFALTPILGLLVSFICALPFVIFALITPKIYNEYISIYKCFTNRTCSNMELEYR